VNCALFGFSPSRYRAGAIGAGVISATGLLRNTSAMSSCGGAVEMIDLGRRRL
jgi:hypothetical protein